MYYLANSYYYTGRYNEARKYFEKFLKKSKDPVLLPGAAIGIADTYAEERNYYLAAQKYLSCYEKFKNSPVAPIALYRAAHCYEILGNYELADSLRRIILNDYKDSYIAEEVKKFAKY